MRRLSVAVVEASIRVGVALRAGLRGTLGPVISATFLVAASAVSSAAQAQSADTAGPGAGSVDELQEVVVTAQFRRESVQQTPLAITALSAATLEQRGQANIVDLANDAPNVTLKPNGAGFGPSLIASIRGVGQFDFNPALEPGVGIYVDDVYYATLTGSVLDLLDLDRVEVLRGPQGTLAGKNSIGGAVKLYSQQPTGDPRSSVELLYGSRNHVEARGSTNFALVPERLFIRFSGVVNTRTAT
jgi:iron complex outermembrane recepter protein